MQRDCIFAVQGFSLTLHGGLDPDQILLDRRQQLVALAAALACENRGCCLRIASASSAVIQSSRAGFISSSIRALVIMPRSSTSITRDSLKQAFRL
jgi:hypothetical protein